MTSFTTLAPSILCTFVLTLDLQNSLSLFIIDLKAASQRPCCRQYHKKIQTAIIGSIFHKLFFLDSPIADSNQDKASPYGGGSQEEENSRLRKEE